MGSTYALELPASRTPPIHRVPAVVVAFAAAIVLLVAGSLAALPLPPSVGAPVGSHASLEAQLRTAEAPR